MLLGLTVFLAAAQPGVAAAAAEAARGAAPAAVRYSWVREDDGSARLSPRSGRGRRRTIPSELFTVAAAATLADFIGTIRVVFTDPLGSRVGALEYIPTAV
jgi:hypothetical protein